jgi:hypothetical protein
VLMAIRNADTPAAKRHPAFAMGGDQGNVGGITFWRRGTERSRTPKWSRSIRCGEERPVKAGAPDRFASSIASSAQARCSFRQRWSTTTAVSRNPAAGSVSPMRL